MIVYNVTIKVESQIAADWLYWLKHEHIPEVLATGCFSNAGTFRLLETDEHDGITFIVQYFTENKDSYYRYLKDHAAAMRQKSFEKWGDKFIAFRSLMQVVN